MRRLLATAYFGLMAMGIAITTIGPSLPLIVDELNLTLGVAGTIISARAVGRLLATMAGGALSDRFGRRPVILSGSVFMAGGLAASTISPSMASLVWLSFIVGMGIGQVDGSLNALVADASAGRRGFGLNMLHVFFGVGALVGPIIAGFLLEKTGDWRPVMLAAAVICLLFGLVMSAQKVPDAVKRKGQASSGSFVRILATDGLVVMLALVMFAYGGTGFGITGWVVSYLQTVMSFGAMASSSVLSLYHVGLTAGRLVCSFIADKVGFRRLLSVCAIGSFLTMGVAVAGGNGGVTVAGFVLTGFFFSGLFPTSIAFASSRYPDRAGTVAGALITANNLGAILVPLAMGPLADARGLKAAMLFAWVVLWVLAAAGVAIWLGGRRRQAEVSL